MDNGSRPATAPARGLRHTAPRSRSDRRTRATTGRASGAFGLCLPGAALVDLTNAVGSTSGREIDKFARYGIAAERGPILGLPVIESGCSAWLECRAIREPHTEAAYDTWFGEVVAAAADTRIFAAGRWSYRDDNKELQTIHHLGGGNFMHGGNVLVAEPL